MYRPKHTVRSRNGTNYFPMLCRPKLLCIVKYRTVPVFSVKCFPIQNFNFFVLSFLKFFEIQNDARPAQRYINLIHLVPVKKGYHNRTILIKLNRTPRLCLIMLLGCQAMVGVGRGIEINFRLCLKIELFHDIFCSSIK